MKKWLFLTMLLTVTGLALLALCSPDEFRASRAAGRVVLDRQGRVLRHVPDEQGLRSLKAGEEEIPDRLRFAFLSAEDQRFYHHPGVDPLAIVRAALGNLRKMKVHSGASTITQQLVRQEWARKPGLAGKIEEGFRALQLELRMSKREILHHYLNLAPMGNQMKGVKLSAQMYFGKELQDLSHAECATLASLPKAPGRLNPRGSHTVELLERRNWVLSRMQEDGFLSEKECRSEKSRPLEIRRDPFPFHAPHFVNQVLEDDPDATCLQSTLDLDIQRNLERTLLAHRERLAKREARQCAALVLDNRNSTLLALAGSREYGDIDLGFNDATLAYRSPGSTLKPFLYALALEKGISAAQVLDDTSRSYRADRTEYQPGNADRKSKGAVRMRDALANSFNLSAVSLLQDIGVKEFLALLEDLQLAAPERDNSEHYGLGLAIGNMEVRLLDLAAAYATLARGGEFREIQYKAGEGLALRVLSEGACYLITDILSDPAARALGFDGLLELPFSLAWKTGSSNGFRDSWIVGYTPEYTVAAWVGNFDGKMTAGLYGAEGAGPIMADIFRSLYSGSTPGLFKRPNGITELTLCTHSGKLPGEHCERRSRELFLVGQEPDDVCQFHRESAGQHRLPARFASWVEERSRRMPLSPYSLKEASGAGSLPSIAYPFDGDHFILDENLARKGLRLRAELEEPLASVAWYDNGRLIAECSSPWNCNWLPTRGRHRIALVGPDHRGEEITVFVE
ncbi:MAG: penicillin-binding protein 1C [Candidatus Krumholzibacteria bacterium]|nr:penicillin-binding protein 1C [Candidatus Krumholzibacteria bacterium]